MSDFEIVCQKLPYRDPEKGEQDIMLIHIKGILDTNVTAELQKVLDDCFNLRIYKLIVDLRKVGYIGSVGVGVFIGLLDTLEAHKGNLVFMHPNHKVQTTFGLFRLSNFFSVTNDIKAALEELRR